MRARCVVVLGELGAVAQLGERLVCNQEVDGSIPFSSTSAAIGCRLSAISYQRRRGREREPDRAD